MALRTSGIALGLVLASCQEPAAPGREPGRSGPSAGPEAGSTLADLQGDERLAFGLATRDYQLWLHTGEPRRYTVKATDGRVLARAIDEATLQRDYPELDHLLENGVDATFEGGVLGLGYSDDGR